MIIEYFISFYFRLLRGQLHRKRLHFFIELREFNILIKENEFGYNMGWFLERILYNYTQMMRLIVKIEKMEKYIKRWDIFDAVFYTLQLNRDILNIVQHIEEQLIQRLTELQIIASGTEKKNSDTSLEKNMEQQYIRINMLILEIESTLSKIRNMKVQLEEKSIFDTLDSKENIEIES